jgi:Glycosyl hydrolase family 67 N-terminus
MARGWGAVPSDNMPGPVEILAPADATAMETLAAREVRRYVYVRTGRLLEIKPVASARLGEMDCVIVARKGRSLLEAFPQADRSALASLKPEEYWLRSERVQGRTRVFVTGGDDVGTLYGAYRLAERLGVRFYLDGDVIPDDRTESNWLEWNERGRPLFALRGIQPFHDFPEGPDWWDADDYLAIISQLPKLGMNFIGLHTYPEGRPNAEPTVWIGRPGDVGEGGRVKFSYPASYQNTMRGNWGYAAKRTRDFKFGSAQLFERDDFGSEVMADLCPEPLTEEECNRVFQRAADLLDDAFEHARRLGVKTCLGTETPLTVPRRVRARLEAEGRDADDPAVVQELYEGIFQRASQAYPLDYYWLWTPEDWTWKEVKPAQITAVTNDLLAAIRAWKSAKVPFQLATCGWVLGPPQDPALFDAILPQNVAVSCINREVGKSPVNPAFARVAGRSKWAIPWLEDDPALTAPQLWVGRMFRDASDARRYGCDGLMGIHWRTRLVGPAVSALAQAAWERNGPSYSDGDAERSDSVERFYLDWARHQFGESAGTDAAAIFQRIDGRLPRPSDWVKGPGGLRADSRSWESVAGAFGFVDELRALRNQVEGPGNRERFDYWLNTFRYLKAMARLSVVVDRFAAGWSNVLQAPNPATRREEARRKLLPLRLELVQSVGEVYRHLLSTVGNPGELGTVANWEQHISPVLLERPGLALEALLGEPLPREAQPWGDYRGPARLLVPTVRTSFRPGESLKLKVLILARDPPRRGSLRWRRMGQGNFAEAPLERKARGVYGVKFPREATRAGDLEYYVEVFPEDGPPLRFPATAPALNQTLVAE